MKRKITIFCFILVCLFCSIGVSAQDMVGVGLKYGDSSVSQAQFKSDYGLNFYNAVTGEVLYTSSAGETVEVNINGGFAAEGKFSAYIEKLSVQSVNQTPITYSGNSYRGYFLLERSGNSASVVNYVNMDQYLYSVLGKEMSASFPAEALKAQAICAKNFVLGESGRHKGFDVCATTHCQVYGGVASEAAETVAAVDAVSGKAAYYNGKIVPLYFFATSGGKTENVGNVWGMEIPYLVSVDDPYEPAEKASRYTWTTVLSGDELGSRLGIGTVTEITVNETAMSGRVLSMTFTGTTGTRTLTKEKCRTAVGTDKLYSQWFTVSGNTGGGIGGVALTANGIEAVAGSRVLSANGIFDLPTSSSAKGTEFTFSGRGYGHGVGMSQWGAYGMAKAGYTYDDILRHYFTGIEVK